MQKIDSIRKKGIFHASTTEANEETWNKRVRESNDEQSFG